MIPEKTLESLLSACNALIRADRVNGAVMRAVVSWDIQNDKNETLMVFQKIIEKYPTNMKAYFKFWEFLVKIGDKKRLNKVSEDMLVAAENTSVPTPEWMKAHSLRAKTLILNQKYKEAIDVLKRQVHVIPPLSIPGLSYLKNGEIVLPKPKEVSDDPFDISKDAPATSETFGHELDGYKYSVGRSSKPQNSNKNSSPTKELGMHARMRSVNPITPKKPTEDLRFSFNESTPSTIRHSYRRSDYGIETQDSAVEEVHYEIERFSVSTDVDFLYQIGKVCAEYSVDVDEGIQCLNDFCLILDYFSQDMDEKVYMKMKTQAKFYIGVCYFRQRNVDATEIVLRSILDDFEQIEGPEGSRFKETQKLLSR